MGSILRARTQLGPSLGTLDHADDAVPVVVGLPFVPEVHRAVRVRGSELWLAQPGCMARLGLPPVRIFISDLVSSYRRACKSTRLSNSGLILLARETVLAV